MGVVKKNTLGNFLRKLDRVESYNFDREKIANDVAELGVKIAREEYDNSEGADVQVDAFVNNDSVDIVAQGVGLAFREFGTGRVGEGSGYPAENLPTTDVPITGNWEYYYDSPHKVTVNGKEGWFYGKTFTEGQKAGMQMFLTSQRLQNELGEKIAQKIKGE